MDDGTRPVAVEERGCSPVVSLTGQFENTHEEKEGKKMVQLCSVGIHPSSMLVGITWELNDVHPCIGVGAHGQGIKFRRWLKSLW